MMVDLRVTFANTPTSGFPVEVGAKSGGMVGAMETIILQSN